MDNAQIRPDWVPSAYNDLDKQQESGTIKIDKAKPELNTRLVKYPQLNNKRGKRLRLGGI